MRTKKTERRYVEDTLRIYANVSKEENDMRMLMRIGLLLKEIGMEEAVEKKMIDWEIANKKMNEFIDELNERLISKLEKITCDCPFGGNAYLVMHEKSCYSAL